MMHRVPGNRLLQKPASGHCSFTLVTVQLGWLLRPADFYETLMPSVSFCLPAHPGIHLLSTYISFPPMQANKKSSPAFVQAGDAVSKPRKTDIMLTVRGALGSNNHGPIQYILILKILDMFLGWNNRRWLKNTHS